MSLIALTCLFSAATSSFAGQNTYKLARELQNRSDDQAVDVIVQYNVQPQSGHFDRVRRHGGLMKRDLRGAMHGAAFHMKAKSLEALANDPDVAYVSPDRPLTMFSTTTDFYDQAVLAPYAWSAGYDGTGIGVAVIDSGVTDNGDFSGPNGSRLVYQVNINNDGYNGAYGHGSHVAGIIAGDGGNSSGTGFKKTFKGIAPNANIISFRVLDQNGVGTDSDVINAIQQVISLKNTYNIRVMNLSLGRPVYESYTVDPLCQAVEAAWKAGIVVVVAAGNNGRDNSHSTNGYGTITAPGNDPYVITVGAMKSENTADRADDLIASYSSKGPSLVDHIVKPDLVAPGNLIVSTLASTDSTIYSLLPQNVVQMKYYTTTTSTAPSPNYFILSGTSMATPVVSGAAALLLDQNPSLTPDQVKARLMKTAYKTFPRYSTATDPVTGVKYTSQYDIFTVGAGYLDIQAALNNKDLAPSTVGSAMSPKVAVDSKKNVYVVKSSSTIWNNSVLWGASVIWGSYEIAGTVSGNSVLWGSSVVWGASCTQGYSVLWGSSVLWGNTLLDDPNSASITLLGEK